MIPTHTIPVCGFVVVGKPPYGPATKRDLGPVLLLQFAVPVMAAEDYFLKFERIAVEKQRREAQG